MSKIILTPQEEENIRYFLMGAVFCWCKHRRQDEFKFRDLAGHIENNTVTGTPLDILYGKYYSCYGVAKNTEAYDKAYEDAGRDGGGFLWKVIENFNKDKNTTLKFDIIRGKDRQPTTYKLK